MTIFMPGFRIRSILVNYSIREASTPEDSSFIVQKEDKRKHLEHQVNPYVPCQMAGPVPACHGLPGDVRAAGNGSAWGLSPAAL